MGWMGIWLGLLVGMGWITQALAAPPTGTDYMQAEANHSDYGATEWHTNWVGSSGYSGDQSWGYAQGMDPLVPGLLDTDTPLMPPLYTEPCPADIIANGYNMNTPGNQTLTDCPIFVSGDATHPQTHVHTDPTTGGIPDKTLTEILDDVLSKMYEIADPANQLTQQLDILFYMKEEDPNAPNGLWGVSGKLHFDETLDQFQKYYTGDISSFMNLPGTGVIHRLTDIYQFDQSQNPVDYIDQWLVGYMKDVPTPDVGAVSQINTWVEKPLRDRISCPACIYTYPVGHDQIQKSAPEVGGHP